MLWVFRMFVFQVSRWSGQQDGAVEGEGGSVRPCGRVARVTDPESAEKASEKAVFWGSSLWRRPSGLVRAGPFLEASLDFKGALRSARGEWRRPSELLYFVSEPKATWRFSWMWHVGVHLGSRWFTWAHVGSPCSIFRSAALFASSSS